MSGIRCFIALIFLFAGLESELRADASQITPANRCFSPTDTLANLYSKTSVDKMTQLVSERIHGILSARVIDPALMSPLGLVSSLDRVTLANDHDPSRTSGSSPPIPAA